MAANSRLTVCVNATVPCLQVGYRFQPLQPSISERNPLGISCPSTLPRETKNCFNRPPVAGHLHGVLFESTSSANSRNVCFGLKSVHPLFSSPRFRPSFFPPFSAFRSAGPRGNRTSGISGSFLKQHGLYTRVPSKPEPSTTLPGFSDQRHPR